MKDVNLLIFSIRKCVCVCLEDGSGSGSFLLSSKHFFDLCYWYFCLHSVCMMHAVRSSRTKKVTVSNSWEKKFIVTWGIFMHIQTQNSAYLFLMIRRQYISKILHEIRNYECTKLVRVNQAESNFQRITKSYTGEK